MQRIIKINDRDIDLEHVIAVGEKKIDIFGIYAYPIYLSSGLIFNVVDANYPGAIETAYMPREDFMSKWVKK